MSHWIGVTQDLAYAHLDEAGTELFETTATFADQGGKTHLTFRALFPVERRPRLRGARASLY